MAANTMPSWPPDDAPGRRDVAVAALVSVWAIGSLGVADTVAWRSVAVGFAAAAIAVGPVAASSIGSQVGAWFRAIGYAGRGVAIVAFAIVVWTAILLLDVPPGPVNGFARGGLPGIGAIAAVEVGHSRVARG